MKDRLIAARKAAELTQQELAAEAQVALSTITKMEQGRYNPSNVRFGVLKSVADAVHVPVEWLANYVGHDTQRGRDVTELTLEEAQNTWALAFGLDSVFHFHMGKDLRLYSPRLRTELGSNLRVIEAVDMSPETVQELTDVVIDFETSHWHMPDRTAYVVRIDRLVPEMIGPYIELNIEGQVSYRPELRPRVGCRTMINCISSKEKSRI